MPESDLILEGGFWETTQDFIDDIGHGDRDLIVYVVRWGLFQPCEQQDREIFHTLNQQENNAFKS